MTEAIETTTSKSKSKAASPAAFDMPKFELPNFEIPKMEIPAAFREIAEHLNGPAVQDGIDNAVAERPLSPDEPRHSAELGAACAEACAGNGGECSPTWS